MRQQSGSRSARSLRRFRFSAVSAVVAICTTVVGAALVQAQTPRRGDRVTVRAGTALRGTPGGDVIGVSSRDITSAVELTQTTFVRISVDGFVEATAIRYTADRSRGEVSGAAGATLRAAANQASAAVAELRRSTYVFPTRNGGSFPAPRAGAWVPARRSLWVDVSRLESRPVAARPSARPAPAARTESARTETAPADSIAQSAQAAPAAPAVDPSAPTLETRGPSSLQAGPGGDVLANIPGGVRLVPLGRENGWMRVRIEGWLPDSSVEAAGTRSAGSLSAADLRANPAGTAGRLVRWSVESLSFQTADELRKGLTPGEAYLLARGPGAERAVLYLALPDSLVARAQALPPLAEITITARVRNGRSQPSGVPVLDLLDLARR